MGIKIYDLILIYQYKKIRENKKEELFKIKRGWVR
jgi:hypothetical protein